MRVYRVVFQPEAREHLEALNDYIAAAASPVVASKYIEAVISYCEKLAISPLRGTARDDVRVGLRVTSYRRRTVIAFAVSDDRVDILGVFHGGRDWETALAR